MNILYITSEAAPFCKTGGLADVLGSLPPAVAAEGDHTAVLLPLYGQIAQRWREKMNFRWLNTQPLEYAYASSEAHWIAALLGRVPMLPTAQLALDTLLIQDGIRLSSQLGREVTAEETIAASVSTAAAI